MSRLKQHPGLVALTGVAAVVFLVGHFLITGPPLPDDVSLSQLVQFTHGHQTELLLSAWFNGIGVTLLALFVYGLVHLAGESAGFAGAVAVRVVTALIAVALIVDAVLIAVARAAGSGADSTLSTMWRIAHAVDYVFPVANSVWMFALAIVLLCSGVMARRFGYTLAALALAEFAFGTLALFSSAGAALNNMVFMGVALWTLAAGISLTLRRRSMAAHPVALSVGA